jgi:hypothetical protein
MTHKELTQILLDAGFDSGWAIAGDQLVIWEHDEDPPKPLTRPVAAKTAK